MNEQAASAPVFDANAHKRVQEMVLEKRTLGWRLVAIFPRDNQDGTIDLIYMFDNGKGLDTIRFTILPEWEIDTVQSVYSAAGYMEGECVDLFGLHFKGVRPGLLLEAGRSPEAPLRKPVQKGAEKEATKDEQV